MRVCTAAALVGVAAGCDDGLATSEMYANLLVQADDGQLVVEASLSDNYVISAGERFYITFRGARIGLQPARSVYEDPYYEHYAAKIEAVGIVQADETLTMTLERAEGEVVEVTAAMPAPFTLTAPATVPASQDLTVTWSPTSSDAMGWRGNYGCAYVPWDGPIREDAGSLTFPANLFEICGYTVLSLSVDRWRTVTDADTGFASARVQAVQTQHAMVEMAP